MNDKKKRLPAKAGMFVACAAFAALGSIDSIASTRVGANGPSSLYNAAKAYRFNAAQQLNDKDFMAWSAEERTTPDPFEALAERGIDAEPIREAAEELELDLLKVELALLDDVPAKADVPAAAKKCLAQALYYEARNQSAAGQMAVADVILNRVENGYYPDSICGVVYQGSKRASGCQFSFTCDGSMNRPVDVASMKEAQTLAEAVLSGLRIELSRGALNYHADYMMPYWAPNLHLTAVVDDHVFYTPERNPRFAQAGAVGQ